MAEGALISVVVSIVKVLGTPSFKELGNFWGHKKKFEKLENTMSLLEAVIQDAEAKQVNSRQIEHWLERLEDAVYEVDSLLDEFQTEALRSQAMPGNETTKKVRTFLSNSNRIAFQVKMGLKLRKVRKTLKGIKDDSVFGMLTQLPLEPDLEHANNRETHSFVRDEEVIGRDEDKMNIIKLLLCSDSQDKDNVSFLPIVGMGGLGKTTLAQFVYNDEKIRKHFELLIWVCISDVFDLKIVLEKMIKSINGSVQQGLELDQLQNSLRQKLSGKRYLLVLDDVWNEDGEKWLKLKTLLVDGSRGSRVLITTRTKDIAQMMQTIGPYELQGLDKKQSWSLFKKVAFGRAEEPRNSNIVRIGEEIVEKCKGVPLSIRTIGSILYGNNLESDWVSFKINKLAKLPERQNGLLPTLRLSYDCLAPHLKHCFAYCRLFPKDYVIDVQKLIKLWMAQGFVNASDQNECLEDIGYGYFLYLLGRSFFHEVRRDELGTIKKCKMHDLMHDLAISVAGEHSIIINKFPDNENVHQKIRHISMDIKPAWSSSTFPMSFLEGMGLVRTFLGLEERIGDLSEKSCEAILSNLKCIRALGLENLRMAMLPDSFDKVKHLRYIDLSSNRMKKLPSSITRLYNLQTLILTHCSRLLSLPRNLKYMISLRHLLIDGCYRLTHMPSGLGELTSLRTLDHFFVAGNNSKWKDAAGFAALSHLNNLRGQLVIKRLSHNLQGDAAKSEGANLKEKQHLQSLHLLWKSGNDVDDGSDIAEHDEMLLEGLQPHVNLKAFRVVRYMGVKFASWLSSLSNLVSLDLSLCENLQHLPSLDQSMSHLKELKLFSLTALQYVNLEGADPWASRELFFPRLEKLEISVCPNLKGWWKRNGPVGLTPTTSSMIHHNQNQPFFPFLSRLTMAGCPNLISMPLFPNVEYLHLYHVSSIAILQQIAMLMKAAVSPLLSPPLASTSSDSFFNATNSTAPTPLSKLNYLHLQHMEDLEILPEEIANLSSSLQKLYIEDCPNLTSLPKGIGNLSALDSLVIMGCHNLVTLPKEMGNLSSLKILRIGRCDKLKSMPEEMHGLISLAKLDISECPNLESLPEWISNLSSLTDLSIKACCMLVSLPQGMHGLTSLNDLYIKGCSNLESLSEISNLSSLETLTLARCDKLVTLSQGLRGLTTLDQLKIKECPNLESLSEGIATLSSLKILHIEKCYKLASLPQGLHGLTSLSQLYILVCPNLKSLPEGIAQLSTLECFAVERCDKLAAFPQDLHRLTSLKEVRITGCPFLSQAIEQDRYGLRAKLACIYRASLDGKPIHAL